MSVRVNLQNVEGKKDLKIFNRKGNKKKVWYCLIYLDGKETVKSLKTTVKSEAIPKALDMYRMVKRGIKFDKKTVKEVFDYWLEHIKDIPEMKGLHTTYRNTWRQVEKWGEFNDIIIYEFDEDDMLEWVMKREDDGKSIQTINVDISTFNMFFKFCKSRKIIAEERKFERLENKKQRKRAGFTQEEIDEITKKIEEDWNEYITEMNLEDWFFDVDGTFEKKLQENDRFDKEEYETRLMLKVLYYFMIGAGCRPKTLQQVKIGQLKKDHNGVYSFDGITEKGELREDAIYLRKIANPVIAEVLKYHKFKGSKKDDFLLTRTRNHLSRLFKKLLVDKGFVFDLNKRERVLYSLRHYYITKALEHVPLAIVCANSQTGINMIDKYYNKTKTTGHSKELGAF